MSDLGDDINEVHVDVGNSFSLLRAGQPAGSGEYCILKMNRQVTKPFIREFFSEASFDWDTQTHAGDIAQTSDGRSFIVMNLTPVMFQDEIIEKVGTLYKCNVSGQLMRPSETEGWDADYRAYEEGGASLLLEDGGDMLLEDGGDLFSEGMRGRPSFTVVAQDVFALQTESLYGHELDSDEMGALGLENHELYLPASMGVQVLDRYQPASGEYYKIETIKKRRFDQVWVCEITEDTR